MAKAKSKDTTPLREQEYPVRLKALEEMIKAAIQETGVGLMPVLVVDRAKGISPAIECPDLVKVEEARKEKEAAKDDGKDKDE